MAVARAQGGPVLTGVHIALIAFVVVTVAALVFLVLMYTGQEDLRQRAEQAESAARSAGEKEQSARDDRGRLAALLAGNRDEDAAAIEAKAKGLRDRVARQGDIRNPDARMLNLADQLLKQYDAKSKEASVCREKSEQAAAEYDKLVKQFQDREKQFGESTTAFQQQYEKQTADTGANLKQAVKPAELLVARLVKKDAAAVQFDQDVQKALDEVGRLQEGDQRLADIQAERDRLRKEVGEKQKRVDVLVAQLAKFRPSNDPKAVLQQADGKVLRVVGDQGVVYIDIGRRDRVTTGLTFAVYSPYRGVTREGRGKATIEVTDVFADTSQCKITSVEERGGVVVPGDLVANPVFERGRTYSFAVAGDFDLDFDRQGQIDDPDGVKVKKIIQAWGGRVVDNVDEQTDFVVLGRVPAFGWATSQPTGVEKPDEETVRIRKAEHQKRVDAFNRIKAAAQELSLPMMTRVEFLQFIGYRVPPGAIVFAIAGDFDLNLDGISDDLNGARVRTLVRDWGGRVVDSVDDRTDFVVLGTAPSKAADAERYNHMRDEAEKLSIPTMTAAQILEFIGQTPPGPGNENAQAKAKGAR